MTCSENGINITSCWVANIPGSPQCPPVLDPGAGWGAIHLP
ncbi:hypothetical protein RHECNPAF_2940055 [Rhizobium etli CNPAF512]|nr:hypothetical protein RHECNPAF_2940055 [Rhizobium etli CNPAF512]